MTKIDTIVAHLRSKNFGNVNNGGSFSIGYVTTYSGSVVPDVFMLYTNNVYLTTNPNKKSYKGTKVYYYLDYNGEKGW